MDLFPQETRSGVAEARTLVDDGETALTVNITPDLTNLGREPVGIKVLIEQSPDGVTWFPFGGFEDPDIRNCLTNKEGMLTGVLTATFTEQVYRHDVIERKGYVTKRTVPTDTNETYYQLKLCPEVRVIVDTFTLVDGKREADAELNYKVDIITSDVQPAPVLLGHHSASLLGIFTGGIAGAAAVTSSSRTTTAGSFITVSGAHFRDTTAPTSVAVTDSKSNSYTDVELGISKIRMTIGYNNAGTRGTTHTVTSTASGGAGVSSGSTVGGQEWDGIDAAPTVVNGNNTTTSTTPNVSVTTAAASLVVGVMAYGGASTTIAVGGSTTQAQEVDESSTQQAQNVGYRVAQNGSSQLDWTLGASRLWGAVAIGVTESGGAAATVKTLASMGVG